MRAEDLFTYDVFETLDESGEGDAELVGLEALGPHFPN